MVRTTGAALAEPIAQLRAVPDLVAPAALEVRNVKRVFEGPAGTLEALGPVSFDVVEGELLCLVGPSGCGKSTLLRCIAGLEMPDEGLIRIGN